MNFVHNLDTNLLEIKEQQTKKTVHHHSIWRHFCRLLFAE